MAPLQFRHILEAQNRITGVADNTPMVPSSYMSRLTGQDFLMKLEIAQPMGAFKLRGAYNAISVLPDDVKAVTCCSTGNHGRAVAFSAARKGLRANICMSHLVPQTKIDGIKAFGADITIIGQSQDEALAESLRLVAEENYVEISPFDDLHVIAGQGTIALEMLKARPDIQQLLIPLSGGGLAGGMSFAAKQINPDIKIVGITMDRGAAMEASLKTGKPIEVPEFESLADSLGGGIGLDNQYSYALCRDYIDDVILVTEAQIYDAMQTLYYEDALVAEGASVVGIAAMKAGLVSPVDGATATVITGRNVDLPTHAKIMAGEEMQLGEITVGQTYQKRQLIAA